MPFKDPEKGEAYQKAYREANREKIKAAKKAYREANSGKVKAYSKMWYEANPEKQKAYYETNREKLNAYYKVRNADPLNSARRTIYNLTGLKKAEIPTELLEAQALIIQIHREIKNHEKLHRA